MNDKKHDTREIEHTDVEPVTPVDSPSKNYLVIEALQRMPPLFSRGLLYLVIGALLSALLYSLFSEIDMVTECRAVAIPATHQLSIPTEESGYVERVFVFEGQLVEKNAPLFSIRLNREAEQEKAGTPAHTEEDTTPPQPPTAREESSPGKGHAKVVKAAARGTLVKLFIKNPGEYVDKFQPLCTILPDQDQLFMDILVTNRDIGFIEKDMEIQYKFDAFPYIDCGVLYGRVTSIPSAAVEDKIFGLVYHVKGTLAMTCFDISGKKYPLKAGMTASAELLRERKSIFSLLFKKLRG
jgi:biotin carboxyl carrier protein